MQITIRNHRLLRLLGFEPAAPDRPALVGQSARAWCGSIAWSIRAWRHGTHPMQRASEQKEA